MSIPLFGEYSLAVLDREAFRPLFDRYWPAIFANIVDLDVAEAMTESERAGRERLRPRLDGALRVCVGIYHRAEFVGWSTGVQESSDRYSMINSAVFPEHRRLGVYSAMLPKLLEILRDEGFQVVYSRHQATNNEVIVPKLRAGFIITGLEVSEAYGTLVQLSYFFNSTRRRIMDYRVGFAPPDAEIRRLLSL